MDVEPVLSSLLEALADRPFVQSVDVETEALVVRGRVLRERDRFLQVYFSEETGTTAFALIEAQQRIWGVDSDDLRGWHVHPVDSPDQHRDIDPMTPEEVVEALAEAWEQLPEPRVKPLPPSSTAANRVFDSCATCLRPTSLKNHLPAEHSVHCEAVTLPASTTLTHRHVAISVWIPQRRTNT